MRTAPRRFRSACADVDLGATVAEAVPDVKINAAAATAKLTEWITRAVSGGHLSTLRLRPSPPEPSRPGF